MKKLIDKFRGLNTGLKRLLILCCPLVALLSELIIPKSDYYTMVTFVIAIPSYWIVVFLFMWIIEGFKEVENQLK